MTIGTFDSSVSTPACTGTHTLYDGIGVKGVCTNASGGYGVYGDGGAGTGKGGWFWGGASSGGYGATANGYVGVYGATRANGGIGVQGLGSSYSSATGGDFECTGSGSTGVWMAGANYAGYANGTFYAQLLTKGSGSFQIDYPIVGKLGSPDTHYLFHGFVESDVPRNTYSGNVEFDDKGEALVEMPEWFAACNGEASVRVTGKGKRMLTGWEQVDSSTFRLLGDPGGRASYDITCPRADKFQLDNATGIVVEKPAERKGFYLSPQTHGHGDEKHEHHMARTARARREEADAATSEFLERKKLEKLAVVADLKAQLVELEGVQS